MGEILKVKTTKSPWVQCLIQLQSVNYMPMSTTCPGYFLDSFRFNFQIRYHAYRFKEGGHSFSWPDVDPGRKNQVQQQIIRFSPVSCSSLVFCANLSATRTLLTPSPTQSHLRNPENNTYLYLFSYWFLVKPSLSFNLLEILGVIFGRLWLNFKLSV